jgi:hypothetical protein
MIYWRLAASEVRSNDFASWLWPVGSLLSGSQGGLMIGPGGILPRSSAGSLTFQRPSGKRSYTKRERRLGGWSTRIGC